MRQQACGALIPYFRRGSPALTDNTCKDYRCSRGYEYKDDYQDITCKYDCDDDECCNKGGFGSAMSPNSGWIFYQLMTVHMRSVMSRSKGVLFVAMQVTLPSNKYMRNKRL